MYKQLDLNNIDSEHICCSLSTNDDGVISKKNWLKERIKEGLVFNKLDERGKVFIEYLPAEHAFAPIIANNYMFIDCFWVSGKFKKQGHGSQLLEQCIEDAKAKEKDGLVVISSPTKKPFLSDGKYLKSKGFIVADKADPFYELLYLPFNKDTDNIPKFNDSCKTGTIDDKGWVIYYTEQCPFTTKYTKQLQEENKEDNIKLIKIEAAKEAQNAPCPFTTYAVFYDGKFVTNEILVTKKFEKLKETLNK